MIAHWRKERHRKRVLAQLDASVFQACVSQPLAPLKQSIRDSHFLVLDFETTGLKPEQSEVLSVGYVEIKNGEVIAKSAVHDLVYFNEMIPDHSVTIHGITEQLATQGKVMQEVLDALLDALAGKILVAHFSQIELGFLGKLCEQYYGARLPLWTVDTLQIEYRRLTRTSYVETDALRLPNARARYGLPRYSMHNALVDAFATAELFLAQVETYAPGLDSSLKEYVLR